MKTPKEILYLFAYGVALIIWPAIAQVVPVVSEQGTSAYAFDLSLVTLSDSPWQNNQNRAVSYLKFVDPNRMLYVYRNNHGLSTDGATPNGGWDDPTFPFRSHF